MDNAKQHWTILQKLETDLANRVHSFMVIRGGEYSEGGEGLLVATEDGESFWLGKMWYKNNKTKTATKPTPLNVPNLVNMAHGFRFILLLNKRGEIYSMGKNDFGQLGLGTVDQETHFFPQLISIPHKFISVRCGKFHSLALTKDGKVWAWGDNWLVKPSGLSLACLSPRQFTELNSNRFVAVECGGTHSLALTDKGEVYGWGWNGWGPLGNERGLLDNSPKLIPTPSPVQSMAAGESHTLLLTHTGEVYACGRNHCGQLGLPTDTENSDILVKVAGLPPISQIASHFDNHLSIAMSIDQRCFVWGEFADRTFSSTPRKLPPDYSTVDSPLSSFLRHPSTPYSIIIPETPPSLSARMFRMFDNSETSDVQFVVEQRTIHVHRIILSNSSDYFARMFSERWLAPVDPEDPIVRVTISDHSYEVFHVFLRFLYTGCLEVHPDLLPELFELAILYLASDLHQACLTRMRTTLTTSNCCLYYQLTLRHSLPELAAFQQELFQFGSANLLEVINSAAYQSMDAELCKKLTLSLSNYSS